MKTTADLSRSLGAILPVLLLCLLAPSPASSAEENPYSGHTKFMYEGVKTLLLKSAERMPEENYGFKPVDGVRSFGQIVGHAADAQYLFCSVAIGDKNPAPKVEQTRKSKADLVAALKEAFAYCDKAYGGMTDASGAQTVKLFASEMPKLGVLTVNSLHSIEHYGNLVVYLRMKGLVPPSSDPGFNVQPPKKDESPRKDESPKK